MRLFGWEGTRGRHWATGLSLLLPAVFVSLTLTEADGRLVPAWRMFWTIFGASNQLLAGLTLMGLTVWLRRTGRSWWMTGVPAVFMLAMTIWSLLILVRVRVSAGAAADPIAWIAVLLAALALLLIAQVRPALSSRPHPFPLPRSSAGEGERGGSPLG